jgi:energy-coupling factor transporter ATP-binding protein EcfA2
MADEIEIIDESPPRLRIKSFSRIKAKQQKWLINNWIPTGCLTLIGGFEGSGKSTYTADLAAQVSRGDIGERPRGVLIYSTEDDEGVVLRPRLDAAGANPDRVFSMKAMVDNVTESIDMRGDEDEIKQACIEHDVGLIILDPIKSSLGERVDTEKEKQLRRALEPINWLAASLDIAVIGIMHYNKRETPDPKMLMSGLRTWSAVARAVLGVTAHPENDGEMLVGAVKNNYGPIASDCLHGRIVSTEIEYPDFTAHTSKVDWLGEAAGSLEWHLTPRDVSRPRLQQAKTWVEELFAYKDKMPSADFKEAQKKKGYSDKLIREVCEDLEVHPVKLGKSWYYVMATGE